MTQQRRDPTARMHPTAGERFTPSESLVALAEAGGTFR